MIGLDGLFFLIILVALSYAVGWFAETKCNRSWAGWGVASFILSPFLVFIALVVAHAVCPVEVKEEYEDPR